MLSKTGIFPDEYKDEIVYTDYVSFEQFVLDMDKDKNDEEEQSFSLEVYDLRTGEYLGEIRKGRLIVNVKKRAWKESAEKHVL